MIILPAIDLINGTCVRLRRGDFGTAAKVAEDPLATAARFADAGASWMHMVDLDGARAGEPKNRDVILRAAKSSGLSVEVGGGIRTMRDAADYLEHGIARVILGSVALKNPALVREAVWEYGEKIAVGIDARDGFVATEGWLSTGTVNYIDLARAMEDAGVKTFIFTDIGRDGMLSGVNTEQLQALADAVDADVIASGGVAGPEDIRACKAMGLYGCICGKALYSGALDLKEALELARQGRR